MEALSEAAISHGPSSPIYRKLVDLIGQVDDGGAAAEREKEKAEAMMEKAEAMMKKARAGAGSCGGGGGGDGDGDGGGGGFTAFLFKCGKLVDEGGKWGEEE